jgi:cytochrome P450
MLIATRDRDTDQPMTNKEMIDEVLTLIVAGHETTAAALTWTWYLVGSIQRPPRLCRPRRTPRAMRGAMSLGGRG